MSLQRDQSNGATLLRNTPSNETNATIANEIHPCHCQIWARASGTPSALFKEPTFRELFMKVSNRRFWVRGSLVLVLAFVAIQFLRA